MISIRLPYPPSLNHLYATYRGRRILSRAGRAYKALVAANPIVREGLNMTGELKLKIDVYRPSRRGDLDNVLKALLDSLTGIVWADDSQIVEIHARRFDDKKVPRVEIEIEAKEPL